MTTPENDPLLVLVIAGEITRVVTCREHPVEVAERIVGELTAARRLADDLHQPLLDLTADEIAALRIAALSSALDHGSDDTLRSALDKLTTSTGETP